MDGSYLTFGPTKRVLYLQCFVWIKKFRLFCVWFLVVFSRWSVANPSRDKFFHSACHDEAMLVLNGLIKVLSFVIQRYFHVLKIASFDLLSQCGALKTIQSISYLDSTFF